MIIVKGQEQSRFFVGNNEIDTAFAGDNLVMGEIIQPPYTELEYIENTNSANLVRIDLDYYWTTESKAQIKVETTTQCRLFGVQTNAQNPDSNVFPILNTQTLSTTGGKYLWWYWGGYQSGIRTEGVKDGSMNLVEFELGQASNKIYLKNLADAQTYESSFSGTFPHQQIGLFDWYQATKAYSPVCKFYYVKIWEGNTLVRDIIPVLDENDTPCVYDKVTKQYFYNKYNGTISYALKQ